MEEVVPPLESSVFFQMAVPVLVLDVRLRLSGEGFQNRGVVTKIDA